MHEKFGPFKYLYYLCNVNEKQTYHLLKTTTMTMDITKLDRQQLADHIKKADLNNYPVENLKAIAREIKDSRGDVRVPKVYNGWNAWFTGIYVGRSGRLLANVYVQGDSTDEEDCAYWYDFTHGMCVTSNHGFRYRFDRDEIAECVKAVLERYLYVKFDGKEEIALAKRKAEVTSDWETINKVVDHFYDRLDSGVRVNMFYPSRLSSWGKAQYDRYHEGKKVLNDYISEHWKELLPMSKAERVEVYKKVFGDVFYGKK